jgi:hypothetical protein
MRPAEGETPDEVDRRSTWLPASSAAARRAASSIVVPKPSSAPRLEDREGRRCPVCEHGPLRARAATADVPAALECPDCGATYQQRRPALAAPRAPVIDSSGAAPGEADTWEPPTRLRRPRAAAARAAGSPGKKTSAR